SGVMGKPRTRRQEKLRRQKIAAAQRRETEGPLPDFVVLGTQKGGTSFFYRLLTEHPLVRGAAVKELHFFDKKFAEGVGWYRRCFSEGERVDGQRTITGEASPSYLFDPRVPERMALTVPEARLIALLRNPVDRAYSHYQMEVRRGREVRSFEVATEEEVTSIEVGENAVDVRYAYLTRGLYAEQLERFSSFANRDRLLVVKSENLFTRRLEVLKRVSTFLGLPHFESTLTPPAGGAPYEPMDPSTRRRLDEFFAPHNERLYDLLNTDFGW
ncbi:MAG TPA: sulfotransferase, partial [Rubrobacter sp.]|nr:sulfotransferase [Rubrobacter sp.]